MSFELKTDTRRNIVLVNTKHQTELPIGRNTSDIFVLYEMLGKQLVMRGVKLHA
jgi:hypothetical protein